MMRQKFVHCVFEDVARLRGDAVAVVQEERSLTYRELNGRANAVASLLARVDALGATVGLLFGAQVEYVAALLAGMKAGALCLPLDRGEGVAWNRRLLEESAARLLVSDGEGLNDLGGHAALPHGIDHVVMMGEDAAQLWTRVAGEFQLGDDAAATVEDPAPDRAPEDGCCLFYTSVDSGALAGVVLPYKSLAHAAAWQNKEFVMGDRARTALTGSIASELSLRDIFVPLTVGGTLCLPGASNTRNASGLLQWLTGTGANVIHATPHAFGQLVSEASAQRQSLTGLKYVFLYNGTLLTRDVTGWKDAIEGDTRFVRLYGTAATGGAKLFFRLPNADAYAQTPLRRIPIGRPISNTVEILVNADGALCRPGEIGELHIKSPFIAVTGAEGAFIQNPLHNEYEDVVVRTGDLACYLADGSLELIGRADFRLDHKGRSFYPGLVEGAITALGSISSVLVFTKEKERGEPTLCAELTAPSVVDIATLHARLQALLPEELVPEEFSQVDSLPRTADGELLRVAYAPSIPDASTEALLPSLMNEIAAHPRPQQIPLSFGQHRLWFVDQMGGSLPYHIVLPIHFKGDLRIDALEEALRAIVRRHESLRTLIFMEKGSAFQRIVDAGAWRLDTSPEWDFNNGEALEQFIQDYTARPFDMTKDYMLRAALARTGPDEYTVAVVIHHISYDRWSVSVIATELAAHYKAGVRNRKAVLPALPVQYADYAIWQRRLLDGEELNTRLRYWTENKLRGATVLNLDHDYARPLVQGDKGSSVTYIDRSGLLAGLQQLSREQGATLFMTMLAAFKVLLYKYSGQDDISIGTPVSGRQHDEVRHLVGFFVNSLVIRDIVEPAGPFTALLQQVKASVLEAFQYQDVPYDRIVSEIGAEGVRNPLFNVKFAQNLLPPTGGLDFGEGLEVKASDFQKLAGQTEVLDLSLDIAIDQEGFLRIDLAYNTDLFKEERMVRMLGHYRRLLAAVVAQPSAAIDTLPLLSEEETHQLLHTFNDSRRPYPLDQTILDYFTRQAAQSPDATALRYKGSSLSYQELDRRSTHLAQRLHALGLPRQRFVPVLTGRCPEGIIATLALWKAGAVYVPLDPALPAERLTLLLHDLDTDWLLTTTTALPTDFSGPAHTIPLDEPSLWQQADALEQEQDALMPAQAHELAYCIYTSGSTGQPKAVQLEHLGLLHVCLDQVDTMKVGSNDRYLQFMSVAFDGALLDQFSTLISGATLVLPTSDVLGSRAAFIEFVEEEGVTITTLTPSFLSVLEQHPLPSIHTLVTAGEAARYEDALFYSQRKHFYNGYGPSEVTVNATLCRVTPEGLEGRTTVPIGQPGANKQVYILGPGDSLSPIGVRGELCVSGIGLARGYWQRPELTAEKFVENPFKKGERLYRTGDVGRWLEDGNIEYGGRIDSQVKLRGYRIELGEIERVLEGGSGVQQAVVLVEGRGPAARLVSYVQGKNVSSAEVLQEARQKLPAYMVPAQIRCLDRFPLTPNGKIDRKALEKTAVEEQRPGLMPALQPATDTEEILVGLAASVLGLDRSAIAPDARFFELGIDSIQLIRIAREVSKTFNHDINATAFFEYTDIRALARHIDELNGHATDTKNNREGIRINTGEAEDGIAIIGMSCHFPGSDSPEAFWQNLKAGREALTTFTRAELLQRGVTEAELEGPYVRTAALLGGKEYFDSAFFGYQPEEAALMDPQTRKFHETCWQALEDAGYAASDTDEKIGLFAGASGNLNWRMHVHAQTSDLNPFHIEMISNPHFMNTLVGYKLNLRGPVVYIDTACSTSLMAVSQACDSLRAGKCSMALAGGVSLNTQTRKGYTYDENLILSADGHCRAFDADATGTALGEGMGAVVLKPLAQARRDGDTIYAVIRGNAVNNDGANKVGYAAPSVAGQSACIQEAIRQAGIEPSAISYVEAHGTGTRLGDPVEIRALNQAFGRTAGDRRCAIGSVKTNLGHLDAAAGIAGLIKVALSIRHRMIPPSLHFNKPNPEIDFAGGPFYVNAELQEWNTPDGTPRTAGLSSFGIGGTNVHLILQETPPTAAADESAENIFVLSARTHAALKQGVEALAAYVEANPDTSLSGMAYTLQTGRRAFNHRMTVVASHRDELLQGLRSSTHTVSSAAPATVFLFPGQGSQYAGMGRGLYDEQPLFRAIMDQGFALLQSITGKDHKSILFEPDDRTLVNRTIHTQPLIFLFEYALAQLLISWGIEPTHLIGHSIGEYVAAAVSGVFTLEEGLGLVAERARLMDRLPAGRMVGAAIGEAEAKKYLAEGLCLAAVNSPAHVVFSGTPEAGAQLVAALEAAAVPHVPLHTSHAFHSFMMEPIAQDFLAALRKVNFHQPARPFISNISGTFITDDEATSPEYWLRHLLLPVRFSAGVSTLLSMNGTTVFVEVGPGNVLSGLLRQQEGQRKPAIVHTVRHAREEKKDATVIAGALAALWAEGVNINWNAYHGERRYGRLPLPTYSFERTAYPTEVNPAALAQSQPAVGTRSLRESIYFPSWKRGRWPVSGDDRKNVVKVLFLTDDAFSQSLLDEAVKSGNNVIPVRIGDSFAAGDDGFTLDPMQPEQLERLFAALDKDNTVIDLVYNWSAAIGTNDLQLKPGDRDLHLAYFSLVQIAKALDACRRARKGRLFLITHELQQVLGSENGAPAQALLSGLMNVIGQEYGLATINIDMAAGEPAGLALREMNAQNTEHVVAIRNGYRWIEEYQRNEEPLTIGNKILKRGGVYLITGGLGNLGLVLSTYLLKNYEAKLVLTGRRHEAEDASIGERLKTLRAIGGSVAYYAADVADSGALEDAVTKAEHEWGRIDGVIHAAGVMGGAHFEALGDTTYEKTMAVLAPKVSGIQNIYLVFGKRKPDFVWASSSLSAMLGGLTFGSYAAANRYMDAFVQSVAARHPEWRSVRLPEMTFHEGNAKEQRDALTPSGISTVFAWSAGLAGVPVVAASLTDLHLRMERSFHKDTETDLLPAKETTPAEKTTERPGLKNPYRPAVKETEKKLVALFEDFFKIGGIGIKDNFFELGGDSLKAMVVLKKINRVFGINLALKDLFNKPDIELIAGEVDHIKSITQKTERKTKKII